MSRVPRTPLSGGDLLIALIADTHLRAGRRLPDACVRILKGADLILHAGDISTVAALDELRAIGPDVSAIHGNVDDSVLLGELPGALERTIGGVTVAMTHDAGRAAGRLERMRRRFPEAAAVVFGHSHVPLLDQDADGFQIFNPGSPTVRRRAPAHTVGLGHVQGGTIRFEHVLI
jgi:uncharacterized protein